MFSLFWLFVDNLTISSQVLTTIYMTYYIYLCWPHRVKCKKFNVWNVERCSLGSYLHQGDTMIANDETVRQKVKMLHVQNSKIILQTRFGKHDEVCLTEKLGCSTTTRTGMAQVRSSKQPATDAKYVWHSKTSRVSVLSTFSPSTAI